MEIRSDRQQVALSREASKQPSTRASRQEFRFDLLVRNGWALIFFGATAKVGPLLIREQTLTLVLIEHELQFNGKGVLSFLRQPTGAFDQ